MSCAAGGVGRERWARRLGLGTAAHPDVEHHVAVADGQPLRQVGGLDRGLLLLVELVLAVPDHQRGLADPACARQPRRWSAAARPPCSGSGAGFRWSAGGRGLGSARGGGLGARTLAQQHDLEREALHPQRWTQSSNPTCTAFSPRAPRGTTYWRSPLVLHHTSTHQHACGLIHRLVAESREVLSPERSAAGVPRHSVSCQIRRMR